MGSVKDLTIIARPECGISGRGRFYFSDRYSVFDWGEMPQAIENKGKALCIIGSYFFEKLQELGIKTHYFGLVEDGQVKKLADLIGPVDVMEVKLLRVLKPRLENEKYDYSVYASEKNNFLIPLEIIYRNSLPEGASIFKRLADGCLKLEDVGLSEIPVPGQMLEQPVLDVSTKLEATDRYVSWDEAKDMAALNAEELSAVKEIILAVNKLITKEAGRLDLINNDGKLELGFGEDRNPVVVDVLGTPDECRFTYGSVPVSKEIARIYYRDTEWYREVNEAKKKNRLKWKEYVRTAPPQMPARLLELLSIIYQSFCNELTMRRWFEVIPLKTALLEINEILELNKED